MRIPRRGFLAALAAVLPARAIAKSTAVAPPRLPPANPAPTKIFKSAWITYDMDCGPNSSPMPVITVDIDGRVVARFTQQNLELINPRARGMMFVPFNPPIPGNEVKITITNPGVPFKLYSINPNFDSL